MTSSAQANVSAPVRAEKPQRKQMSDMTIRNLFIAPTLLLLIAMNVFPLFYSLYLSFTNYSAIARKAPVWVGIENYVNILTDPQMWQYFNTTGKYTLLTVSLQVVLGFALAMLVKEKFAGSGIVTTLILIPMMLSPVVVGLFWKYMYNPSWGYLNWLMGFTNPAVAPDWLASSWARKSVPGLALWAVVFVDVWMWTPFVMLLVLSGLKAIPDYLYEAAAIDRASSWFQFWRITVPQVAPLLMIAILFRTIEALKSFDLVMGMTGGGPGDQTEVIAVNLYRKAFLGQWQTGEASALAYIVLIIIIAISNLYVRYLNRLREG
jgi:multiple sugar transport system permease protein